MIYYCSSLPLMHPLSAPLASHFAHDFDVDIFIVVAIVADFLDFRQYNTDFFFIVHLFRRNSFCLFVALTLPIKCTFIKHRYCYWLACGFVRSTAVPCTELCRSLITIIKWTFERNGQTKYTKDPKKEENGWPTQNEKM